MNCKVGDLVRYVGVNPFSRPNVYGWIGRVIEPIKDHLENVGWVVDPPLPGGDVVNLQGRFPARLVRDEVLKPINNPGDDAVDEMARRIPLTLPEIIPAMLDRETV